MVKDPMLGYKVVATVTGVKGKCNVDHRVGESFDISIHNAGGLCGSFYHNIFPSLQTFQFGGSIHGGKETLYSFNAQIAIIL